jgi:FAD/FMN-containing dehydrogenase
MHLYPIDGAARDVDPDATAWAYRSATWGSVFAGIGPEPADAEAVKRWSIDYFEALHPYSAGGAYVNMMMDEGAERVKASYGANYTRLTQVKAEYDPDNLFRVNQNIPPAR